MSKKDKQEILTGAIIVAIIALGLIIAYIVYGEISKNNDVPQNNISNIEKNTTNTSEVSNTTTVEKKKEEEEKKEQQPEEKNTYVGKEEDESTKEENTQMTKEEKAIKLAKDKWGKDDSTVTFNIEEKKDNIYYISVKSDATSIFWYEVNTETWTISEFY